MTTPVRICVVGSSNIDLFFRTARLPKPGETLSGRDWFLGYGGKGANQAVMASRLGAKVVMVSRIGKDVFGEGVLNNFQLEGIDIGNVRVDDRRSTGLASIVVDDDARNCILLVPGANQSLTPQDVRNALPVIQSVNLLLCQLEVPLETTLEACRLARAAGVRTVLNPAPAIELPKELLALVDYCIPNESEIELLTGLPTGNLAQCEKAALDLLHRGPKVVLLTLGASGTMIAEENIAELIPSTPVHAVDTSGAGDAFIGSFAVFLSQGAALREAVRKANAVAALSVTRPGTQTSFPRREEVEALLAEASPH
ncbi:MAG: ribokinase [Gemmataceae bacterium]